MPIENITLGRFRDTGSVIHKLDPRTKGFCALSMMTATFAVNDFKGLAVSFAIAIIFIIMAKTGFGDFLKNMKAFIWLFVITFALHLFFSPYPGESNYYEILGMKINSAGAERGFFYSGRIALLLAYSYLLMVSTAPLEIADGLEKALKPLKIIGFPAHETAMVLSIALRFVPTLLDEAVRIKQAQLCRGAKLEGNVIFKIKGFSSMLIPLFTSAFQRADYLAMAMEARGYRGGEGRTSYTELKFKLSDLTALIICAISIILTILI
ncbi:energy-coupling factor transporter transmembrane protein EcfT [bacterium]|nr:energy-coupling factor transporter transmembrane protein EcfT [bacterium]